MELTNLSLPQQTSVLTAVDRDLMDEVDDWHLDTLFHELPLKDHTASQPTPPSSPTALDEKSTCFQLPSDVLFAFDWNKMVPALIDTGAAVSVIPKALCPDFDQDFPMEVSGLAGTTTTLGSVTYQVGIDLPVNPPHKLYVAECDLEFLILGTDFLAPRQLGVFPHLQLLVQESTNHSIQLTRGRGSLTPESFWGPFLDRPTSGTNVNVATVPDTPEVACSISPAEKQCLELLDDFPGITGLPDYTKPPSHNHVLDIEVVPEFRHFSSPARPCSTQTQKAVDEQFAELISNGALARGSSRFTSPITVVSKKDGTPRVCVDYTRLNSLTLTIHFPLPTIQSLPQRLQNKHCWFSSIDLKNAYHSLPLTERASKLAAIITRKGIFLPLRTPFGLKNAAAKFCELVADITNGLEEFCFAYMDDFLVFSETLEDHLTHLRTLFSRLEEYGMYVNEKKCKFARQEVNFLGRF